MPPKAAGQDPFRHGRQIPILKGSQTALNPHALRTIIRRHRQAKPR
jgi:hypothetical protein